MNPVFLKLHPQDNVGIAIADIPTQTQIDDLGVTVIEEIKRGHKFALGDLPAGTQIIRYGQIIGATKAVVAKGTHLHVHNMSMTALSPDYAFCEGAKALPPIHEERTFQGFRRKSGKAGTRNYVGVLTSVNCSGTVARFIAEAAEKSDWFAKLKNIDGIVPIVHSTGCGMSGDNEGYQTLFRTLSGYAKHPNFSGILLVGLGCEVMQIPDLVGSDRLKDEDNFKYMTIQQTGGTRKTIEKGVEELKGICAIANQCAREPIPISELVIGMQCGGSDSYSGITANPALGAASDLLVQHGGTTILSETSEIYGAEHLLTRRAATKEIGEKLVERVHWWEDYTARNKGELNNNPSPGNKRGGLTTILEKSLGAVAKGGMAPLEGVYLFGEPIDKHGFVFMDSPGYDPCSVTGQVASGANLIVFTTGRGSVSGYKPVPGIKIATNSDMYNRMQEDMDINCGDIIDDGVTLEDKGHEIFEHMIKIASGEQSKSEALGFGGVEFVPWQIGAVM